MKRWKRILAGIMAASIVAAGMAVPAFGDEGTTGTDGTSDSWYTVETDRGTVVDYFANGNSVTIAEEDGKTYMYLADNLDQKVELPKNACVYAGGTATNPVTGNGKIVMNGGYIQALVGSNAGEGSLDKSEITVNGGSVGSISINEVKKQGTYADRAKRLVNDGTITIAGGTVRGYVRAAFSYCQVNKATINIIDGEVIKDGNGDSVYAGSNGYVGEFELNITGGTIGGKVSPGQRTHVGKGTINFTGGEVKGGIFAGSSYSDLDNGISTGYWNSWGWGDVNYGVTDNLTINISGNAKYKDVFAGFQFEKNDVKKFVSKYNLSTTIDPNLSGIADDYGFLNGDFSKTAVLNISVAGSGRPSTGYTNCTSLTETVVDGVTVNSAPSEIAVTPSKAAIKKGGTLTAKATVESIASVSNADMVVEWTSSDPSVATVATADDGGRTATITGVNVGAATITASCTETINGVEYKISDEVQVSVGGDFAIEVSPAAIKLGDTITFKADIRTDSSTATDSNASYDWSFGDDVVASEQSVDGKTLTAKATGAGNGTVKLVYTDSEGQKSEGNVSFTVQAPELKLTIPDSVEIGKTFKAITNVSNITGNAEDLGIKVGLDAGYPWLSEEEGHEGVYLAVDYPETGITEVIATMQYPAKENGEKEVKKNITVTMPDVEVQPVYLDTGDAKELRVKLPLIVKKLTDNDTFNVEIGSLDDEIATVEWDPEANTMTVTAHSVGNTTLEVTLFTGTVLASYPVVVTDSSLNAKAEDGSAAVDTSSVEVQSPALPEEASSAVSVDDYEQKAAAAERAIHDLAENAAVVGNESAVENLAASVEQNQLLNDGEYAKISLEQTPKSAEHEAIVVKDASGNVTGVKIVPKKLVIDVTAHRILLDEKGKEIAGTKAPLDLSSNKITKKINFKFRLPIPSTAETTYVNVEHEGDPLRQYTIQTEGGHKFITVSTWHLSDFILTFTNDKLSTASTTNKPTPANSGGSGSGTTKTKITDVSTNKTGEWIQNATGWWFRYSDGTWPAGKWVELDWNGVRSWYYFNADGYMATGWKLDGGYYYYLHPYADGTQGFMYTGWHSIGGKWYYFSTVSGGPLGSMAAGTTTPDGYRVGADGAWIQ